MPKIWNVSPGPTQNHKYLHKLENIKTTCINEIYDSKLRAALLQKRKQGEIMFTFRSFCI